MTQKPVIIRTSPYVNSRTRNEETQSILLVAYELCKQKLTLENPWPNDPKSDILVEDQLDEATAIAIHAWLKACEKLELEEEREPGMDELQHACVAYSFVDSFAYLMLSRFVDIFPSSRANSEIMRKMRSLRHMALSTPSTSTILLLKI